MSGCMEGKEDTRVVPTGTHLNTLSAETPEELIQRRLALHTIKRRPKYHHTPRGDFSGP